MEIRKLFEDWQAARLKYPQFRREAEDAFFGGLVTVIEGLQAPPPKPDAMAKARAVLAEKREAAKAEVAPNAA